MMAQIKLKDIVKRFPNGALAVASLNLDIADGEFLVLLGPSGCGKTTTLRSIAGLERQTSGDIFIGERLVNDLPAGLRDIAFVFQFYALYPHMSAYDNIAFPLRATQISTAEVDQRVQSVAQKLRIEHLLKRRPNRLASGEQQRVALGRAMVRQPQVFLMDEPLTNLDASLRADMRVELKHLQSDLGVTMVYVTHDQVEAMSMGQRIAVMNLGVLQQVGAPLDIYERPQTLFVAGFIGNPPMTLIPVELDESNTLRAEGIAIPVPPALTDRVRTHQRGAELVLGIRAEDSSISAQEGVLSGCVRTVEPLGDETIYTIEVGSTLFRTSTSPTIRHAVGAPVKISFNTDRIHLFDAHTQQRVM